jgi:hypothetical protein
MSKERLTGKRAVWFGLLGTPVLLVAAVTLIGVTAGSAGPSTAAKQAALGPNDKLVANGEFVMHVSPQSAAEIEAYWTSERMASAQPMPIPTSTETTGSEGAVGTIPQMAGPAKAVDMRADGTAEVQTVSVPDSPGALHEPFHGAIPYTQFQWFGRYLRNVGAGSPNLAISAVHKMFFTLGSSNFVCSSSTVGQKGAWTAGHCLSNGAGTFATNVLHCPSYDSSQGGVNPVAGCWAATELYVATAWHNGGDFDQDFGATQPFTNGTVQPGLIGNFTGWLGLAWNITRNLNWMSFGYPQAAPFTGGKIEVCASSFGYTDNGGPDATDSSVIGCDMTGGSSGGPWIWGFGRFPTQPGGAALLRVNGHNDWRHTAITGEMASPYYDNIVCLLYELVNDVDLTC